MKITKYLVAALAVTTLFACSKSEETNGKEEKANLTVSITGGDETRTTGEANETNEKNIMRYHAFVLKNNQVIANKFSADASDVVFEDISTSATHVYIAANVPDADYFGTSISTKAALEAKIGVLATGTAPNQTATQTGANLWASGTAAIPAFTPTGADGKYESEVTVTLKFVSARVRILSITDNIVRENGYTLDLKNIVILNAGSETKFFGNNLYVDTPNYNYLAGIVYEHANGDAFNRVPGSYEVWNLLKNTYVAGSKYYYYLFENYNPNHPTIITIEGEITNPDSSTETRWWSTRIEPGDVFKKYATRGDSYDLSIILNGNAGDKPGGPDPTDPNTEGDLTVKVTPATWNPVTKTKTFDN